MQICSYLPATLDYTVTSGDLIFNATTSSLMVTIPILEDSIVEGSETIIVTLTSADPAILSPPSTCVTIEDNDGKYSYIILWLLSVKLRHLLIFSVHG